jgi:hypothetical protein
MDSQLRGKFNMANDRLLEKIIDEYGRETIKVYTYQELIDMNIDAPEQIALLQQKEQEGKDGN